MQPTLLLKTISPGWAKNFGLTKKKGKRYLSILLTMKMMKLGLLLEQFNLGWMYDTGEGVEVNPEAAIAWYGEAAKQGDQYAPYNIGFLYYTGSGVIVDFAKAQFWFLVARLNGNLKVDRWLRKNVARMSDEQKNQAIALFEAWKVEHLPVELSEPTP